MKTVALFGLVLMSFAFPAYCDPQRYSSPEAVVAALKTDRRNIQEALARELGIKNFDANEGFEGCAIRAEYAKLDQLRDTSVLSIDCRQSASIVVLVKQPQGDWTRLDSMDVYAPYEPAKREFRSLIRVPVQEIVIHNAATVSGSVYEAYLLVVRLIDNRLRTVLAVLETAQEPHYGSSERTQSSRVAIESATPSEAGAITVTSNVTNGKWSNLVHRSFSWDEELQAFVEDGVARIDAPIPSRR